MTQGAICDLKYFAGRANELHLLRDRVAELEDLLGISETITNTFGMLGLTRSEAAVLGALYKKRGGMCTREFLYDLLYGSTLDCDQPNEEIIPIWIFKLRRKLRPHRISILNVWGQGFRITDADKLKLAALIEAARNGTGART